MASLTRLSPSAVAGTHGWLRRRPSALFSVEVEVHPSSLWGDDFGNTLGITERVSSALSNASSTDSSLYIRLRFSLLMTSRASCLLISTPPSSAWSIFLVALPAERDGDDADGQMSISPCKMCNDGCGTRSGTTAHSGSDEYHLGAVVQHILDVFDASLLLRRGFGQGFGSSRFQL